MLEYLFGAKVEARTTKLMSQIYILALYFSKIYCKPTLYLVIRLKV